MGEDFALHGHWSIATMEKQVVACRRRLEQKQWSQQCQGWVLPVALSGFEENLFKKLAMQESLMDPMF